MRRMCHRRLPIAIALATGLAGVWCGKSPSPLPQVQTGALRVVAMDTMAVNTIHVNLDDVDLGQQENPARLDQIVIGTHKLFVYTPASAGTTKTVEVKKNSLTTVWFWLATTGPYVGNIAPLFTVQDVTGAELSLEEQKGKVVLLIFFEHTWQDCLETELPSIMTLIRLFFSSEDLTIWAFNNTASEAWLQDYIGQTGITYPFAFDASGTLFNDYQVGLHFGNIPPAYLIIDQNGTVRYRLDNQYNRFQDMKDSISALLDNEE